jgi:putative SOS response-associated peptidase YedK
VAALQSLGLVLRRCEKIYVTDFERFGALAEVHDRMPVLLTEQQFEPWLTGEAGQEFLRVRFETQRRSAFIGSSEKPNARKSSV